MPVPLVTTDLRAVWAFRATFSSIAWEDAVSPLWSVAPLASVTLCTTCVELTLPSLAIVAKPVAFDSGLTWAVPSAMRLLMSQPSPVGTPAALAMSTTDCGPLSMVVTRSVKAVFIEYEVALSRVTLP